MTETHPMPETIAATEPFRRHLEELQTLRRSLPVNAPASLKRRLNLAIQVASSPTCPESQADGVPCGTADTSCDQCARALEFIETVRAEIDMALHGEDLPEEAPEA